MHSLIWSLFLGVGDTHLQVDILEWIDVGLKQNFVCVCMYINICVCVYIYMYAYVYVYLYTYVHA